MLEYPALALDLARKELGRMGKRVLAQVERVVPTILTGSVAELTELADDDINDLHDAVLAHLRRIDDHPLNDAEGRELVALMEVASSLEIVRDIVRHELLRVGFCRRDEGIPISDETLGVVGDFHAKMTQLLSSALQAFAEEDVEPARTVLEAKPEVNELLAKATAHHATRIHADAPQRVAAYSRGTEKIEHLRRISTFAKRIARSLPETA